MPAVEIEYCVPCGHRDNAIQLANSILEAHSTRVDGVTLVPGDGGIFEVRMDGEMILDTDEESYDMGAILDRIATQADA